MVVRQGSPNVLEGDEYTLPEVGSDEVHVLGRPINMTAVLKFSSLE